MKDRDDIARLEDMIKAIIKIEKYTDDIYFEEFEENELIQDAVFKNFEIIGEAAYKVSKRTKKSFELIEWRNIEALRHKLVHDYYEIDLGIVWNTKEKRLPELRELITKLLKKLNA